MIYQVSNALEDVAIAGEEWAVRGMNKLHPDSQHRGDTAQPLRRDLVNRPRAVADDWLVLAHARGISPGNFCAALIQKD